MHRGHGSGRCGEGAGPGAGPSEKDPKARAWVLTDWSGSGARQWGGGGGWGGRRRSQGVSEVLP